MQEGCRAQSIFSLVLKSVPFVLYARKSYSLRCKANLHTICKTTNLARESGEIKLQLVQSSKQLFWNSLNSQMAI